MDDRLTAAASALLLAVVLAGAPATAAQPPLRVYISADMEGIAGVAHSEMTSAAGREYERGRRLMTAEVNAAIEGALEAGATAILVNDAHGSMRNILIEELHPAARLVTHNSKPMGMMEGLDESADAVFFIGYHARAGNPRGLLAHTGSGRVADLRVHGRSLSEGGMNAGVAAAYGVPVVLATGDEAFVEEIRALLGPLETVAVKRAIRRESAELLPLAEARRRIREAARRAVERRESIATPRIAEPVVVELEYTTSDWADIAAGIPCVRRTGPRTIRFETSGYLEAYRFIRILYRNLAD